MVRRILASRRYKSALFETFPDEPGLDFGIQRGHQQNSFYPLSPIMVHCPSRPLFFLREMGQLFPKPFSPSRIFSYH
jgi:hypothetical protein